MISEKELQKLFEWDAKGNSVLSVYLERDHSWDEALHDRLRTQFKSMTHTLRDQISPSDFEAFDAGVENASKLIAQCNGNASSYAFFIASGSGLNRFETFNVPLGSRVHWGKKPYVLPILEAFDEYERYGVVLMDRRRARIFTFCLGQVEDEHEAIAWNDIERIKTTGRDNIRSQKKLARTNKLHTTWHLKHVVDLLIKANQKEKFDRLILSGITKTVSEFYQLLPPALQKKVVERIALPMISKEEDVEKKLFQVEARIEREKELELVQKLTHEEPWGEHRVFGLEAVLDSAREGLIHQLIYSETFPIQGGRCPKCGALFSAQRFLCGKCKSAIEPLNDFLQELTCRILKQGGKIEEVRAEAAERLNRAGGIAAIVKQSQKERVRK